MTSRSANEVEKGKRLPAASSPQAASSQRILGVKWDGRDTFNVNETAEILRISVWAAWQAVNHGEIPIVRIGRRCIVPRHALERLLSGEAAAA